MGFLSTTGNTGTRRIQINIHDNFEENKIYKITSSHLIDCMFCIILHCRDNKEGVAIWKHTACLIAGY